jgi:hypothetical protein
MTNNKLNKLRKEVLDIIFEEISNPFAKFGPCHYIITKYRIKDLMDDIKLEEARDKIDEDKEKVDLYMGNKTLDCVTIWWRTTINKNDDNNETN